MSRVTAIISALLSASSSACRWLLIITDNAITYKASATKMPENCWRTAAITDMQMRQRDVAALDAKYTKELADAKAENDALRDDVAAVVVGCTSKQSVSQCASHHAPAWIMQPPPDWQTPLTGLFHPQREADHYAKTTGREPRSILMKVV